MTVSKITENEFRKMIAVSSNRLNNNAEFINSLNVFPVPDGDTGTNMSLSFASGAKYVSETTSSNVGELAQALAKGLLMGARGNSGVILSQVFRGFSKNVAEKAELTPQDLADAIVAGVQTAYKAVMKPQEGTILTVARKAAEAATKTAKNSDDCVEVMQAAYEAAEEALKTTPELLPVLKEVGVVDSGGQGLTFVYQGFFDALSGNVRDEREYQPTPADMDDMVSAEHHKSAQGQLNTEDIKYGYCTEIMVRLGAGRLVDEEFDYDKFRQHLSEIGNSLLVIADDEVVKVHVHTEQPGEVLSYGQKFGSLIKVKVDNMRLQHETILEQDKEAEKVQEDEMSKQIAGDYGIIAVASGDGIAKLFHGVGVTKIIQGGQTMNPSTKDIVDAINETGAKKILILPNNKNIFLAAEQASDVVDADVKVVHTRTIPQGLTAMLEFSSEASIDENVEAMEEALADVVSGQVTIAVRDTTIDGAEIKKDNYMGIVDGTIKVTDAERKQVTLDTIHAMLDVDDGEVVTIIYGEDASQAEAQEIADEVQSWDEDYEVEIHEGDQPVYPYLISVE